MEAKNWVSAKISYSCPIPHVNPSVMGLPQIIDDVKGCHEIDMDSRFNLFLEIIKIG